MVGVTFLFMETRPAAFFTFYVRQYAAGQDEWQRDEMFAFFVFLVCARCGARNSVVSCLPFGSSEITVQKSFLFYLNRTI